MGTKSQFITRYKQTPHGAIAAFDISVPLYGIGARSCVSATSDVGGGPLAGLRFFFVTFGKAGAYFSLTALIQAISQRHGMKPGLNAGVPKDGRATRGDAEMSRDQDGW